MAFEGGSHSVHDVRRTGQNLVATGGEVDLLQDQDVTAIDDDLPLIRATIFILMAVVCFRIVRTLVHLVQNVVQIVVRLGTTILVLKLVKIFRIVGALVALVGDAVLVVVQLGAAVIILKPITILWIVRALVHIVVDTVPITIGAFFSFGTTITILIAVFVFGHVRTAIDPVE